MSYRYYSSQRPVSPGSFPKPVGNRVLEIVNFDKRTPCYDANCDAWGYIEYEKPLGKELARCYELVRQKYPLYIKCGEYIGRFQYEESKGIPIYRFPGGDRVGDSFEIEHGSNNRKELEER